MLRRSVFAGLAISVFVVPTVLSAETITVRTKDKSFVLNGKILSFDSKTIDISTSLGTIRVDRADVSCEGAACPPVPSESVDGQQVVEKTTD